LRRAALDDVPGARNYLRMADDGAEQRVLVSYLTLRRVVGVLGVALPIVVAVWGLVLLPSHDLLPTISDYYRLRTRDAFVGVLFVIAWFLFTYRGYDRRDEVAGDLACVAALCVAFFPDSGTPTDRTVHRISAAALFLVLSYFSLVLFTESGGVKTERKKTRNRVYVACGVIMLACIALIAVCNLFGPCPAIAAVPPVFLLETLALWAFGFSWFVKGETIWKDRDPAEEAARPAG
jgi:hypothetical protein